MKILCKATTGPVKRKKIKLNAWSFLYKKNNLDKNFYKPCEINFKIKQSIFSPMFNSNDANESSKTIGLENANKIGKDLLIQIKL